MPTNSSLYMDFLKAHQFRSSALSIGLWLHRVKGNASSSQAFPHMPCVQSSSSMHGLDNVCPDLEGGQALKICKRRAQVHQVLASPHACPESLSSLYRLYGLGVLGVHLSSAMLHGAAAACSHLVVLKLPARLLGRAAVRPVAVLHVSRRPLLHHRRPTRVSPMLPGTALQLAISYTDTALLRTCCCR